VSRGTGSGQGEDLVYFSSEYDEAIKFLKSINPSIDLTVAMPMQGLPNYVKELSHKWIERDITSEYPDYGLLKSACRKYWKRHGVTECSVDEVFVDTSTFSIIRSILNHYKNSNLPNSILIPSPTFGGYLDLIPKGFNIMFSEYQKNHKVDIDSIIDIIETDQPSILLLTNPVNPTGEILSEESLKKIASVCKKYSTFVISDEIFADTARSKKPDGNTKQVEEIPSMAQFMPSHLCCAISGIGKSYGAAGLRVSYAHTHPKNISSMFFSHLSGGISSLSVKQTEAILSPPGPEEALRLDIYRLDNSLKTLENTQFVRSKLRKINDVLSNKYGEYDDYIKILPSDATTVALLDFSALKGKEFCGTICNSGTQIAEILYKEMGIGVVPGEASMIPGKDMICRVGIADKQKLSNSLDKVLGAVKSSYVSGVIGQVKSKDAKIGEAISRY